MRNLLAAALVLVFPLSGFAQGVDINGKKSNPHDLSGIWMRSGGDSGFSPVFDDINRRGLVVYVEAVDPDGASFEDGYRCAVVCDVLDRAAREGRRVMVEGLVTPMKQG